MTPAVTRIGEVTRCKHCPAVVGTIIRPGEFIIRVAAQFAIIRGAARISVTCEHGHANHLELTT